jgi:hypothetical protein
VASAHSSLMHLFIGNSINLELIMHGTIYY